MIKLYKRITLIIVVITFNFSLIKSNEEVLIVDFFNFYLDENNIANIKVLLANHSDDTLYFILKDIGYDSNIENSRLGIQLFFNNTTNFPKYEKVFGDFGKSTLVELPPMTDGYVSSFDLTIKTRFKNQNVKDFEYVWLKFHYFTKSSLSNENISNLDCNTSKKVDNNYRLNLGWMKNRHVLYHDNQNRIDFSDSTIKTLFVKTKVRIVDYDLTK